MKFSPVVFWSVLRLTLYARPDVQSEGDDNDETGIDYCDYQRNSLKKRSACGRPGNTTVRWIRDHGWFLITSEPCYNAPCCDNGGTKKNGRYKSCQCVHHKDQYDLWPWPTKAKCCSPVNNFDGKCGEAQVGKKLRFGAIADDCHSGSMDSDRTCVKMKCTVAGLTPQNNKPCCRSLIGTKKGQSNNRTTVTTRSYRREMYDDNKKCGCIHAGDSPATRLDHVGGNNCCSTRLGAGGKCSCIDNSEEELLFGAVKDDCCTKETVEHEGKTYCKADKCLGVGATPEGGAVCCSGVTKDKKCGCLAPGKAIPADQDAARTCCSGEADHDDNTKCGHLHVGEDFDNNLVDPSVCSSGTAEINSETKEGTCLCIPHGTVSHEPSQCCSKWHDTDKKCGCLPAGAKMEDGAKGSDCCSGSMNDAGECGCLLSGFPSTPHLKGQDCCTKNVTAGFCGCYAPKQQITQSTGHLCCNGHWDSEKLSCSCLPEGTAVGPYVHDGACCDKKIIGGVCKKA